MKKQAKKSTSSKPAGSKPQDLKKHKMQIKALLLVALLLIAGITGLAISNKSKDAEAFSTYTQAIGSTPNGFLRVRGCWTSAGKLMLQFKIDGGIVHGFAYPNWIQPSSPNVHPYQITTLYATNGQTWTASHNGYKFSFTANYFTVQKNCL